VILEQFVFKVLEVPFVDRGRDWDGLDCWGLIRLAYLEIYDIELPSYVDQYDDSCDRETIRKIIELEKDVLWHEVDQPIPGDVALLRILGHALHTGLMVDTRRALHTEINVGPMIEELSSLMWRNRVEGYYRHDALI